MADDPNNSVNEQLIKTALEKYHQLEEEKNATAPTAAALQIEKCSIKLCTGSCENFCSHIYLADVKYSFKEKSLTSSLIVKLLKPEMAAVGSNEETMLCKILPEIEKVLSENSEYIFHPRCLLNEKLNTLEYYVMENLNASGYYCADRSQGLDYKHAGMLMKKIAEFHAASMILVKKNSKILDLFGESRFTHGATDPMSEAIAFGGLNYVADLIKSWPNYEETSKKIMNFIPKFNKLMSELVDPKNSRFNVINHGDLWVNNFLYKYEIEDEQRINPQDVKFVDFQISFYGGCGFDLNYFFNTSLNQIVLMQRRMDLLKCYYKSLRSSLEASKFYANEEIPLWQDLLEEVKRSELVGLYCSLCEFPLIVIDKSLSKEVSPDDLGDSERMHRMHQLIYGDEKVQDFIKYPLKYYEEMCVL